MHVLFGNLRVFLFDTVIKNYYTRHGGHQSQFILLMYVCMYKIYKKDISFTMIASALALTNFKGRSLRSKKES